MFHADEPIKTSAEDKLGRREFAKYVSDSILAYEDSSCLVLGIIGEWGSGKTSIINMITEHLEESNKTNLKIIKFNPWLFSGQEALLLNFFEELRNNLGNEIKEKLDKYLSKLVPDQIGVQLGLNIKYNIKSSKSSPENLEKIKDDLDKSVENANIKLVIVIDDIDRLTAEEIRQIFQMIKIVDLPNTVYISSFDKKTVVKALEKVQEGDGEEYLEKIIHVPFEIPPLGSKEIREILESELKELFKEDINIEDTLPYLKNMRNVKKYMNLLKFKFNAIGEETNKEDLANITILELFEPKLYKEIYENRESFTSYPSLGTLNPLYEKATKKMKEIYKKADNNAKNILKSLFPLLNNITWPYDELRKEKRICTVENFDTYFKLSINESLNLSSDQIRQLIKATEDSKALKKIISKDNFLYLKFLNIHVDEIPPENIVNVLATLLDIEFNHPDFYGCCSLSCEIIFKLLRKMETDRRLQVIKKSIRNGQSIYLALYTFATQGEEKLQVLGEKELESLINLLIEKLHRLAQTDLHGLFYPDTFGNIIELWNVIEPYGVDPYIRELMKDDHLLVEFIKRTTPRFNLQDFVRVDKLDKNEREDLIRRLEKLSSQKELANNAKRILEQLKME
ncbi:conserved hypothetical protein [Methanothermobacter marburgensis str. Marburg]|uniref:KAP NTPase domain-containing protein n=1 Tax=Methanothermobacter marburgensis (strain ATCC BAA-927 / DSM 2133 / JCM 14651 / NBRC 100331 / OCM 82 / Marburg) TaxID=79929 RepID=D9PVT6_METTM|nr:P-loop NTPase fold protein [Methanothermobacter marburgensis]ADL58334.1 conserved hypothetical protein [Methanothermobacter marburgensis str. Marburg]